MLGRCAAAVLLGLTLTVPASAEQRITLLQARSGSPAVWTVRPDGTGLRTVGPLNTDPVVAPRTTFTTPAPNGRDYTTASFRPAGNRILGVFVHDRRVPGAFPTPLQPGFADAVYAPSGDRVALLIGTELEVMSLPDGTVTPLGTVPSDLGPIWSPDETRLAFLGDGVVIVPVAGGPQLTLPLRGPRATGVRTLGRATAAGPTAPGYRITWTPGGDAI